MGLVVFKWLELCLGSHRITAVASCKGCEVEELLVCICLGFRVGVEGFGFRVQRLQSPAQSHVQPRHMTLHLLLAKWLSLVWGGGGGAYSKP